MFKLISVKCILRLQVCLIISFVFAVTPLLIVGKEIQNYTHSFYQTGKVVGVMDGDTFEIVLNGFHQKVRLAHIDCPEKNQPFGMRAKQYASDLCFARDVQLIGDGKTDRYGRIIAEVYIGNTCVNKELVKAGLAWHFLKYSDSREYDALEREARLHKRGLWADPSPIAPWDWRAARRR